mmetsp:Transcript_2231/g.6646  ORF Transcript_2231/g.6646 Transcript_2231/m.6646 type:complete len:238 (-) Transcript_2231:701-1414(-)|eukprot:4382227-Prymnesium_polylepis.4
MGPVAPRGQRAVHQGVAAQCDGGKLTGLDWQRVDAARYCEEPLVPRRHGVGRRVGEADHLQGDTAVVMPLDSVAAARGQTEGRAVCRTFGFRWKYTEARVWIKLVCQRQPECTALGAEAVLQLAEGTSMFLGSVDHHFVVLTVAGRLARRAVAVGPRLGATWHLLSFLRGAPKVSAPNAHVALELLPAALRDVAILAQWVARLAQHKGGCTLLCCINRVLILPPLAFFLGLLLAFFL